MIDLERGIRVVDRWQRRHRPIAFVYAVVKKFGDDAGGSRAALLAYYAFLATFPMLLVLFTLLEIVLAGNPELQDQLLDSALAEFPVIGDQLRQNVGTVQGQGLALAIGLIVALLGARGLARGFQQVCNDVWSVPMVRRPMFPVSLVRTLGLILVLAGSVVVGAVAASITGITSRFGLVGGILGFVVAAALNVLVFLVGFRVATAATVPRRALVPAAVVSGVVWQILLTVGGALVSYQLRNTSAAYGTFAIVLGLLAWFVVQATATVYAAEIAVVHHRRLWPRGILEPLTPADERAQLLAARAAQLTESPEIHVQFTDDGRSGAS